MLTGRKYVTLATVIVLCALATAGCKRRSSGSTTINGSDIFTTDSFPGNSVQDGNVADDQRAMSNSGENIVNGSLRVTFNGDRCVAMVTYATGSGLYAHHWDGSSWTPPVAIRGIDQSFTDAATFAAGMIHAFLNTSDHASGVAQDRDGDCLIAYVANDTDDDGAGTADDINRNVWVTYFDVSARESVVDNYGFDEFSTRISANDELGEDAVCLGMVTDGLCGGAIFSGVNFPIYRYGDQTTAIEITWIQRENNDAVVGFDDDAYHSVRFDPAEAIVDDLPLSPSADTRLAVVGLGASDSGTSSEETRVSTDGFPFFEVYNELLFFRVGCDNQTVGDDPVTSATGGVAMGPVSTNEDVTLQYTRFDLATGGIGAPVCTQFITPSTADTDENNAQLLAPGGLFPGITGTNTGWNVYGSDEGLACCVYLSAQLIDDPDGDVDFGDLINDARIVITEIDENTGSFLEDALVDIEDPDINDPGAVNCTACDIRLSRNGDYIWIAWLELTDSGATDELGLWVAEYMTTRIDDGTFPVPDLLSNTLSSPINASPDFDGQPVAWLQFQFDVSYVCGAQSDAQVMSLFYEQSDGTFDEIDQVELTADLVGTPVVPAFVTTVFEVFEEGDQFLTTFSFVKGRRNFVATDSGEGGNVFAAYRDDVDGTATDDFRLFAEKTGVGSGFAEIDSAVSFRMVPDQILNLAATPPGGDIGSFDPVDGYNDQAHHGSGNIHVLFAEDNTTEDSTNGDALRTRQFRTEDTSTAFGDNFVPNAGSTFDFPFSLGLPSLDPVTADQPALLGTNGNSGEVSIVVSGDNVGVWFRELDRVYYQEFGGSGNDDIGWVNNDGVSNPFLVDDDNDEELSSTIQPVLVTKRCPCDRLECAITFWAKQYGSGGSFSSRLQSRVRE